MPWARSMRRKVAGIFVDAGIEGKRHFRHGLEVCNGIAAAQVQLMLPPKFWRQCPGGRVLG